MGVQVYSGSRRLTRLQFMGLFTQAERVAIRAAAKTDGDVEDIVAMLSLAEEVVLESPATDELLTGLVGKSLLTSARKTEILNGETPS